MITIDKWLGLVTNASPYAIQSGAAVTQVNLQIVSPGQISVRPGGTEVSFASHTGGTTGIWRVFRYPGVAESLVYQSQDGIVRVARGPS